MTKNEVNWDGYELTQGPKAGDKQKAVIATLKKTCWRDYLTENGRGDKIGSFEKPDAAQLAISVKTEDGREFTELFSLPEGKQVSAISNLGKFKDLYNKFPEVGDEIEVMADKNGFWNIFVGV